VKVFSEKDLSSFSAVDSQLSAGQAENLQQGLNEYMQSRV
jgi:hypothetical protein